MINITIDKRQHTDSETAEYSIALYPERILLSEVLRDTGLDSPCGGMGICGKCKIYAEGDLSEITETELAHLSSEEIEEGIRLACLTYAEGNVKVRQITQRGNVSSVHMGAMREFIKNPLTLDTDCYGMAVDIGTTTVAVHLYKLPECEEIDFACMKNEQSKFGADVISRIEHSNNGRLFDLQKTIVNQLTNISKSFGKNINMSVITGNTTMLHLLTGLDPRGIAVSPFEPVSLFGALGVYIVDEIQKRHDLVSAYPQFFGGNPSGTDYLKNISENIYIPRCISAYVGADVTTGILASGMLNDSVSLYVDIGTNGEMALCKNGELVCCSTAAGPAFEGAGIKYGSLAVPGAINTVYLNNNDSVMFTTIDNDFPTGICGSGLIDALACMLRLSVIDDTGYMEEDSYEIGNSGIFITAEDIRAVQLAKSAIRSGIDTLLDECSVSYADIDKFYIAGGFGNYLNIISAANIGLIPREMLDKTVILGNAALSGASMILQSRESLDLSEKLAETARCIELSGNNTFMAKYIDNMMF